MMKKYFTAVPLPLSIAISAILGAVGSGVLILALFAGGLIGLTLFLLGMAAAGYGAHRLLYHVCFLQLSDKGGAPQKYAF